MKVFPIFLLALLISSCAATNPVSTSAARAVPLDRIFDDGMVTPSPDKAEIAIVRDSSFGGQCALAIYLDGEQVSYIEREEKLTLFIAPGKHILGGGPNPLGKGVCSIGADKLRREIEIRAELGARSVYRLAMLKGEVKLMPTAF